MWSRRKLLVSVAPAAFLLGWRRKSMLAVDTARTPTAPTAARAPDRQIEGIYSPPGLHWVGDGFRVAGYFSAIRDAARKLSPFLLLDYHPTYDYAPTAHPRGVGVHPRTRRPGGRHPSQPVTLDIGRPGQQLLQL